MEGWKTPHPPSVYRINNLVYLIQCKQCSKSKQPTDCQYIGQTGRTLPERFGEHRRDIINHQHEKSGVVEHFNRTNHSLTYIIVVPLETIRNRRESFRRAREQQHIIKANNITPNGVNRTTDR